MEKETIIELAEQAGAHVYKNGERVTICDNGISGSGAEFVQKFAELILDNVSIPDCNDFKSTLGFLNVQRDQLRGACLEALSLFENYPECNEMVGTYQRLTKALESSISLRGEKNQDPWCLVR
jgi:hypothetical protein